MALGGNCQTDALPSAHMSALTPEPVGLKCPACGEPPVFLLGDTQAWCQTDDCPILTWNPTMTLAELNADSKVVDLRADGGKSTL